MICGRVILARGCEGIRFTRAGQGFRQQGTKCGIMFDQIVDEAIIRLHWLDRDQPAIWQLDYQGFTRVIASIQDAFGVCLEFTQLDDLRVH